MFKHHSQRRTYWCAPARNCIPTCLSRETSSVTTEGRSNGDISEGLVCLAVQPWVDESKWLLAGSKESVIDKSDDGSKGGTRG